MGVADQEWEEFQSMLSATIKKSLENLATQQGAELGPVSVEPS